MLSDHQIAVLIKEEKTLKKNFRDKLKLKQKSDTCQRECDISAESGLHSYIITVRVNTIDPFDYSVILQYTDKNTKKRHILRRYNGPHTHENVLEGTLINGCHIHKATERYQQLLDRIDGYAESTNLYNNWDSAFAQMIIDCNFRGEDTFIIIPPVAHLLKQPV
jgi:hypothetical protein